MCLILIYQKGAKKSKNSVKIIEILSTFLTRVL